MDRFFAIILGLPTAIIILKYRRQIKEFIGDVGFAEKFLGIGGTNTLVILIALAVFIGSLMYGMGTFQELLGDRVGALFGKK